MHTQVMEGICTAGTLEEGEVVWQVRTRARILHTQTHRSTTAALHVSSTCMCTTHRQRELCAHRRTHLHPQVVMEGIYTAGTLEEGEVVWQVRTRARILHTQTHRSTTAALLHM